MKPRTRAGRLAATVVQSVLSAWFVLPLIPIALWALARSWTWPDVLPRAWGLDGFAAAWQDGAGPAFGASLLLGGLTAALATPTGAMAAYALAYGRLRGRRWISLALLAPVFVPPFVIVMGLNVILLRLHVPQIAGILFVLTVTALPYTVFVMRSAFAGYDTTFEDEARILGAAPGTVLLRVRIPLLAPALAASAFLAFLVGWSDYIITVIVGGGELITVPMRVAAAASGTGNAATVAALSVAAIGPPLLLLLVMNTVSRSRRTGRHPAHDAARTRAHRMAGATV